MCRVFIPRLSVEKNIPGPILFFLQVERGTHTLDAYIALAGISASKRRNPSRREAFGWLDTDWLNARALAPCPKLNDDREV